MTNASPTHRSRRLRIAGFTVAAVLLVAGGGYAITGAVFTDQQNVAGNSVGAAVLKIGPGKDKDVVGKAVAFEALLPGQTSSAKQVLDFVNGGNVPFQYTVTIDTVVASKGAPDAFLSWIPVVISQGDKSATGTLASPPTLTIEGPVAPGTAQQVSVSVGLDKNATNDAQGKGATFGTTVTASQVSVK